MGRKWKLVRLPTRRGRDLERYIVYGLGVACWLALVVIIGELLDPRYALIYQRHSNTQHPTKIPYTDERIHTGAAVQHIYKISY
jgi:hypothetical protein